MRERHRPGDVLIAAIFTDRIEYALAYIIRIGVRLALETAKNVDSIIAVLDRWQRLFDLQLPLKLHELDPG